MNRIPPFAAKRKKTKPSLSAKMGYPAMIQSAFPYSNMSLQQEQSARLEQIRQACRRITLESTHNVRMKYLRERYVHRVKAESSFRRFLRSKKTLFLVLGGSGTGKTNLLCWLSNSSMDYGPILFLTGLWRSANKDSLMEHVFRQLKADLGRETNDTWQFIRELDEILVSVNSHLIIFVDGINETDDQEWVINGFRDLFTRCPPTFRFVLSCRTDSFQLHFRHPFWSEHVYYEDEENSSGTDDLVSELEKSTQDRYDTLLSTAQRLLIELAIKTHKKEVKKARAERLKVASTSASVLLDVFTDEELAEAIRSYGTTANLVGDALEDCHDPLLFRLFADTVGRNDVEVSDVFTLSNAERYLSSRISEAATPDDSDRILSLLFRIARHSSMSGNGDPPFQRLDFSAQDASFSDKLVESGLLIWRQGVAGEPSNISFSFDRILSFVLALEVSRGGEAAIVRRLSQIVRSYNRQVIHIYEARYLLLFLDRIGTPESRKACSQWATKLLHAKSFRLQIMPLLPELGCLPFDSILSIVDWQLWSKVKSEDEVKACANTLSSLCRKGYSSQVLDRLEPVLKQPRLDSHLEPLVRPLAACFDQHRERCGYLLELLCGELDEIGQEDGYKHKDEPPRRQALQNEIERFPFARLKLVEWLASSSWGTFRSIAAAGVPALWLSEPETAGRILKQLENDTDDRVRSSLAEIIVPISRVSVDTSINLCVRLGQDPESAVRKRFVTVAGTLASLGHIQLHRILQSAVVDPSPIVRSALVDAAAECLSEDEHSPGVHQLMQAILEVMTGDSSNVVKHHLASSADSYASRYPRFAIDLLLRIAKDKAPNPLRSSVIDALGIFTVDWTIYSDEADRTVLQFEKDKNYNVCRSSIPFLSKAADLGSLQARRVLFALADATDLELRNRLLEANARLRSESLTAAIMEANVAAPCMRPANPGRLLDWIRGVTETKLANLSWKESLDRLRRNVGILGIVISLLSLLVLPISHAVAPNQTASLLDWRTSPLPLLLGMCLSMFIALIQRWLDIHYYTGAAARFNGPLLLACLWPVPFGISTAIIAELFIKDRILVIAIILATLLASFWAATARVYITFSDDYPLILLTGYYCGLFASLLTQFTNDSYFGLFFLCCPLVLNWRGGQKIRAFVGVVLKSSIWACVGSFVLHYFVLSESGRLSFAAPLARYLSQPAQGAAVFALICLTPYACLVTWLNRSRRAMIWLSSAVVLSALLAVFYHGWTRETLLMMAAFMVGIEMVFIIPLKQRFFLATYLIAVSSYGLAYEGSARVSWMIPVTVIVIIGVLIAGSRIIWGEGKEEKISTLWGPAAMLGFIIVPVIYAFCHILVYSTMQGHINTGPVKWIIWFGGIIFISIALFLQLYWPVIRSVRERFIGKIVLWFSLSSAAAAIVSGRPLLLIFVFAAILIMAPVCMVWVSRNPDLRGNLAIFILVPQVSMLVIGMTGLPHIGFVSAFIITAVLLKFCAVNLLGQQHSNVVRSGSNSFWARL